MTCADVEILLCDLVDGTLHETQRRALEAHLDGCKACAELAADVTGAAGFLERVAVVDPPAELLTRIVHLAPSGRIPWWRRIFGSWVGAILQPKYAMGMAMTVLSFSMIARFAHIEQRQLKPSDLDPVKIWTAVDDRALRTWDRAVKYYENLRWVLELQAQLKDFTEQEQQQQLQKSGTSSDNAGKKPVEK